MEDVEQEIRRLKEENFCLRFEMNTMANLLIKGEAERWLPGFLWKQIEIEHKSRYDLAIKFVEGKRVIEMACGSGYGAFLLASKALEVQGYDIDTTAVEYGRIRYPAKNVYRAVGNAEEFNKENYFDAAVSFETIEHLNDHNKFLTNIYNSLKENGIFLVSTPIVKNTRVACENPHHKIEWSFHDFQNLIKEKFDIRETYIQSVRIEAKKKSVLTRILLKVKQILQMMPSTNLESVNPYPVLFTNQYDTSKIIEGYQLIVCQKKNHK